MASSLLALIDDIATILDDVAVLSKVAARKTAGVLGDDLALNAEQVSGVRAERELPVVWAVAKGSFINKLILVPSALLISALAPWAVIPLLMLGGLFLCYEGFEKVAHKLLHSPEERKAHHVELVKELVDNPEIDLVALEKDKIKGAVRTDFILSAEIIVITLGTVASAPFMTRVSVISLIAIIMTVGVYGLVAGIVKIDDVGLYLSNLKNHVYRLMGRCLLAFAPWLMKALSIAGTIAMFLVGGGIMTHAITQLHHLSESFSSWFPSALSFLAPLLFDGLTGLLAGGAVVGLVGLVRRFHPRYSKA